MPGVGSIIDPACPVNWAHPLNRGLVGWWMGLPNPGWSGGNTLRDLVRGKRCPHDGTLTNGPTWNGTTWKPSRFRTVSLSSGSSQYINTANFTETSAGSVSVWFTPASTISSATNTGVFCVANLGSTGNDSMLWRWDDGSGGTNGSMFFWINSGASYSNTTTTTTTWTAGVWYNVVGTWGGSNIKVYVNGRLENSTAKGSPDSSSSTWKFGASANGSTARYWNGKIGPCEVHQIALSQMEIFERYQQARSGFPNLLNWVKPIAYSVPVAGGTTFSATASLTTGAATLSGSASHTPPSFTGSAAVSVGSTTLSASATYSSGTFTASAGLTAGGVTLAASASFSAPVYTATGTLTTGPATLAATATFTAPVYTATAGLTVGAAVLSATAGFTSGTSTGTATFTVGGAVLAGSGLFTPPVFTASASLAAGAAILSGSATATPPTFTGLAGLTTGPATLSGSASHTPPTWTGSGTLTVGPTVLSGSASFGAASIEGTASLTIGAVTLDGVVTFTPEGGLRARIVIVCDAVVDAIDTDWSPTSPDAVTRVYEVDIEPATLTGRQVYVFPEGYGPVEPASRKEYLSDYTTQILVVERYTDAGQPDRDWLDERVLFMQGVHDLLNDLNNPVVSGYWAQTAEVTVYDLEMLREHKTFWSVLTLTYRTTEAITPA